ncbi:hypothetical protein KUCAC02_026616, partial [Chaenocephalus aceratus]
MLAGRKRRHVCHPSGRVTSRRRPVTAAGPQVSEGVAVKRPDDPLESQEALSNNTVDQKAL